MVVACIALAVALGGSATAAVVALKKNSVRSIHIKNNQVKGADVDEASLAQVPSAATADNAANAANAQNAASAQNAANAANATNAENAANAQNAANAESAAHADDADHADHADNADDATRAQSAANADQLGGQPPYMYAANPHNHNFDNDRRYVRGGGGAVIDTGHTTVSGNTFTQLVVLPGLGTIYGRCPDATNPVVRFTGSSSGYVTSYDNGGADPVVTEMRGFTTTQELVLNRRDMLLWQISTLTGHSLPNSWFATVFITVDIPLGGIAMCRFMVQAVVQDGGSDDNAP